MALLSVKVNEHALLLIVSDEHSSFALVHVNSVFYSFAIVILALDQLSATTIANSFLLRWNIHYMEACTAGFAYASSCNTLYENLRDMVVAEEDDTVVGVGALHIMWDRLAEVRMMAIAPDRMRQGIGAEIVRRLLAEGDALGIENVFTLTYKPDFFRKLGFIRISREELPQKVWKECIDCPKYPNCDEIAMIKV